MLMDQERVWTNHLVQIKLIVWEAWKVTIPRLLLAYLHLFVEIYVSLLLIKIDWLHFSRMDYCHQAFGQNLLVIVTQILASGSLTWDCTVIYYHAEKRCRRQGMPPVLWWRLKTLAVVLWSMKMAFSAYNGHLLALISKVMLQRKTVGEACHIDMGKNKTWCKWRAQSTAARGHSKW